MGSVSARKLCQIVANVRVSLAIEIMTACAGLDQRLPLEPSLGVGVAYRTVREVVPVMKEDRPLYRDIGAVTGILSSGKLLTCVENEVGTLA